MAGFLLPALAIGGAALSGFGGLKANEENKAQSKLLGYQADNLEALASPIQSSLVAGWQPGGFLRGIVAQPGIMDAERGFTRQTQTNRANAWRYGGRTSGRFLGGVDRARRSKFLRMADARNQADVEGERQLSRIASLLRGYDQAYPVDVSTNPYLGIGQGINQFIGQVAQEDAL